MRIRGNAKKKEQAEQAQQTKPEAGQALNQASDNGEAATQAVEPTTQMVDSSGNGADASADPATTQLPAQDGPAAEAPAAEAPTEAPPTQSEPPRPSARTAPSGQGQSAGRGPVGFFRQMWGDDGMAKNERERQAAAEFEAAIRPAKELLMASVPDASSPEEAARRLQESQPELLPDPEPSYPRDWYYKGDAVAYYQVRKHIGKPRARVKRQAWTPPPGLAAPQQNFELPPSAYGN